LSARTTALTIGVAAIAAAGAHLVRHRQVSDLRARLRRAEHAAIHDPLTGLPNRGGLLRHLDVLLAADRPMWVLLADLDQFKQANDRFGHDVGDQVIVEVAHRLRTIARPGWQLARLHGDEFAGCGPGDLDTGIAVGIAIRNAIHRRPFQPSAGHTVPLRISVGVAAHRIGLTSALLLKHADRAMYDAKDAADGVIAYRPTGADIDHIPVRPKLRDRDRPR